MPWRMPAILGRSRIGLVTGLFSIPSGFLEIDKTRKRGLRPGIAISLAVFAFTLFGDSLRDFLDPRFKV
jgi:hypothetical protein